MIVNQMPVFNGGQTKSACELNARPLPTFSQHRTHSPNEFTSTVDGESKSFHKFGNNFDAMNMNEMNDLHSNHELNEQEDEANLNNFLNDSINSDSIDTPRNPIEGCLLAWSNIKYEVCQSAKWTKLNSIPTTWNSSLIKNDTRPATTNLVSWTNNGGVGISTEKIAKEKTNRRVILNSMSGCVQSGQLMAIIGPSGVGKSSLLQVLAGRQTKRLSGRVELCARNEQILTARHVQRIAFIPQTDVHMSSLTVEETLMYASKLKNQQRAERALRGGDDRSEQGTNATAAGSCCSACEFRKPINDSVTLKYDYHRRSPSSINNSIHQPTIDSSSGSSGALNITSTMTSGDGITTTNDFLNSTPTVPCNTCTCSGSSSSPGAASTEQLLCDCRDCSEKRWFINTEQFHRHLVQQILHSLSLSSCAQTLVSRCSGGQVKRLSLAVELLSRPRVIIMDEPTTGLDFRSALNCVNIMRSLTRRAYAPPAIIASIHQPSSCVLKLFDHLYVMANGGNCIYDGPTSQLITQLARFGIDCPTFFNPADLLLQIASGEYEKTLVHRMTSMQRLQTDQHLQKVLPNFSSKLPMRNSSQPLAGDYQDTGNSWIRQWQLLISRSARCSSRKPLLSILRLAYFSFFALFIYCTYNYPIGSFDGCAQHLLQPGQPGNQGQSSSSLGTTSSAVENDSTGSSSLPPPPPLNYAQSMARLADNASLLFFVSMFLVISAILPAALTFPSEFAQFARECSNGWYGSRVYFAAKWAGDLPAYVGFPLLFAALFYPLTGQPPELWRFGIFSGLVVLISLISRSIGLLIGTIFLKDYMASVFVSTCAVFPFMLASGFLVRPSVSTWLLRPFWHVSFVRYTFGCLLLSIYGFGRCDPSSMEENSSVGESVESENESAIESTGALGGWTASMSNGALQTLLGSYLKPEEIGCVSSLSRRADGVALVDGLLSECKISADSLIGQPLIGDLSKYDHSFILSYFEIRNEDFYSHLAFLMILLLLLTFLNYWLLIFRVRRCARL